MVAAYAGSFSRSLVAVCVAVAAGILLVLARGFLRTIVSIRLTPADAAIILISVVFAVFCITHRFHEVEGLRDPGVYVASGIELSRTGDFGWFDAPTRDYWFRTEHLMQDWGNFHNGKPRWERFAGFYLTDHLTGRVEPQFLHGYETWIALAYSIGGPQATQCVNGVFGALAIMAFFCVVRLLAGAGPALFSAALLALNPAQLWFGRFPSNEAMIQALIWGFLLMYLRFIRSGGVSARPHMVFCAVLLPLLTACLVKIAAWLFLPIVAFDAGIRCARREVRISTSRALLLFTVIALVAYLHAFFFANFYLHGSSAFTAGRLGISFTLLPILFATGTAAAVSLGSLVQERLGRFAARLAVGNRLRWIAVTVSALVVAALAIQVLLLRSHSLKTDLWNESTNLAEMAFYFTLPLLVAAIAGLGLLFTMRSGSRGILVLLLCLVGSSVLLVTRNIDAQHPWAARRWVPFLIPILCAGAGFLAQATAEGFVKTRGAKSHVVAFIVFAALAALSLSAAPQLIRARNYRGVIPAMDRIAELLPKEDFILAKPTGDILQWGPYLKARFDIDVWPQPNAPARWIDSVSLMRTAASEGRRTLYVTDEPLTMTETVSVFVQPEKQFEFSYEYLPDTIRALPREMKSTTQKLFVYNIDSLRFMRGWSPESTATLTAPVRRPLPVKLDMTAEAEPYLERFFDPTPAGDLVYRWNDGTGRIDLGQLLEFPIQQQEVTISIMMNSGRPEIPPVKVIASLNSHNRRLQHHIASFEVSNGWHVYSAKVPAAAVQPHSTLLVSSLRPPVEDRISGGVLGVMIAWVQIE